MKKKFFAVYVLRSLHPQFTDHACAPLAFRRRSTGWSARDHRYVGFTVNPKRRIRQHNGDIVSGAKKTSKKRPCVAAALLPGMCHGRAHSSLSRRRPVTYAGGRCS
jgi:hypothetical protein